MDADHLTAAGMTWRVAPCSATDCLYKQLKMAWQPKYGSAARTKVFFQTTNTAARSGLRSEMAPFCSWLHHHAGCSTLHNHRTPAFIGTSTHRAFKGFESGTQAILEVDHESDRVTLHV
jgi:hypothetical protein